MIKIIPKVVEKREVVVQEEKIVIELTREQAEQLKALIGRTGGRDAAAMATLYFEMDRMHILNNYKTRTDGAGVVFLEKVYA